MSQPPSVPEALLSDAFLRPLLSSEQVARELARRDAVLQAVVFAADMFLGPADFSESIPAVLERLGIAADASRAYLFEAHHSDGPLRFSQRYEWVAPGITPQIDNPELQDMVLGEIGFGRWVAALSAGKGIQASSRGSLRPSRKSCHSRRSSRLPWYLSSSTGTCGVF